MKIDIFQFYLSKTGTSQNQPNNPFFPIEILAANRTARHDLIRRVPN
jgi:hypothetical protein